MKTTGYRQATAQMIWAGNPSKILIKHSSPIFSTKQSLQNPCVKSRSLPWAHSLPWARLLTRARKSLSGLLPVLAKLAIPATLLAAVATPKRWAGLLLLVLAPISEVAFRLFDRRAGDPSEYWNAFYFMQSAGPHISGLLVATAFFLLLHDKMRTLAILPGAYKLSKILWLSQVSTNEQYHQFVPWGFLLIGLSTSIIWFVTVDYLMSLHFHKREGIIARIIGVMDAPGISPADKERIARSEIKHLRELA